MIGSEDSQLLTALVVAIAVVIVVWLLRERITRGVLRVGHFKATLEAADWRGLPEANAISNHSPETDYAAIVEGLWEGESEETYVESGDDVLDFGIRLNMRIEANGIVGEAEVWPTVRNSRLPDRIRLNLNGKMQKEWVQLTYNNPTPGIVQIGVLILSRDFHFGSWPPRFYVHSLLNASLS